MRVIARSYFELPRGRKLRLDLHTHCHEATYTTYTTSAAARAIVAAGQARGLDGLAITDHIEYRWSFQVRQIVEDEFGDAFLIIPGQEAMRGYHHIVDLYLAPDRVFSFMAHPAPRSGWQTKLSGLHGVEIANPHHEIDEQEVRSAAEANDLLLLRNSDGHSLDAIGTNFNEIDPQELMDRARGSRSLAGNGI